MPFASSLAPTVALSLARANSRVGHTPAVISPTWFLREPAGGTAMASTVQMDILGHQSRRRSVNVLLTAASLATDRRQRPAIQESAA